MRRCWRGNPDLHVALAAGGALDGPAPVDEAPIPPEVAGKPVDAAHIRPPGLEAYRTGHERPHAVVDQRAERVDHGRVGRLGHERLGRPCPSRSPALRWSLLDLPCSGAGGAGWSAARLPMNQSKFGPGRITTTSSRSASW